MKHADEDQIAAWMLGVGSEEVSRHLETCGTCRAEADELRTGIGQFAASVHRLADRDSLFWSQQRFAIGSHLPANRPIRLLRWAWTAVVALVLAAMLLVTRAPRPQQQANGDVADDVLLQQVQSDIEQDFATALAPAVLISQERSATESTRVPADIGRPQRQEQKR